MSPTDRDPPGSPRDELPETIAEPRAPAPPGSELRRGDALGRYLVLERLGAGGMGVVYAAYDPELDRRVAVKLLHPERIGAGEARLLREAQALARLQHPNVIAVHDVGTFGDRVFVAMEFVDGETLAELVERRDLSWREIVDLHLQAGRGLAAAHAAGLVHRDFKPENVLVGRDGRVRVLDFGLARAAGEAAAEAAPRGAADGSPGRWLESPLTRVGVVVGTPAYIAPEQFDGAPADARSDQFAFAVALHRALYGTLPFRGESLDELISAVRAGRIEEPLASGGVPRQLRGILLRALSRDPEARFPDMASLLEALADDPLVRRRRGVVRAAAAVGVLAMAGAAGWFATRGERLCGGAERRLDRIWDDARKARLAAAFVGTGVPFAGAAWNGVRRALDPWTEEWVAARTEACAATHLRGEQSADLLDRRMGCLDGRLEDLSALTDLFEAPDAKLVEKAVQAAWALPPVETCADLDALLARVPPPEGAAARQRVERTRRAVARVRALRTAGRFSEGFAAAAELADELGSETYRPLVAEYLLERADLENRLGEFERSETTLEAALTEAIAGNDRLLAAEISALAINVVGVRRSRHADGHRWADRSFAFLAGAGGDDRVEAMARGNLGALLTDEGETDLAAAQLRTVLTLLERTVGSESPEVGRNLNNLGNVHYGRGELAAALETYRRALEVKEAALGPDHPDLTSTLNNLALVHSDLERWDEAMAALTRAMEMNERLLGPDHPTVALELVNLAAIHEERGRHQEALEAARRALAINERALGVDHPNLGFALTNIGNALVSLGRPGEAMPVFARALALRERSLESGHPQLAFPLVGMGRALLATGRARDAVAPLRRAVAIRSRGEVDAAQLAEAKFELARASEAAGAGGPEPLTLAREARAALIAVGGRPRSLLIRVEQWLAAREGAARGSAPRTGAVS